jgi:hypothetical protein
MAPCLASTLGAVQSLGSQLHVDDDDAALRCVAILFALFFAPVFRLWTAAFVAHGDLEARPLMATALLLLAATDLFDDPRFEHGTENL